MITVEVKLFNSTEGGTNGGHVQGHLSSGDVLEVREEMVKAVRHLMATNAVWWEVSASDVSENDGKNRNIKLSEIVLFESAGS